MISRTPSLDEWPYRMVRLAQPVFAPRPVSERNAARTFRGDALMPDVRHVIAESSRKIARGATCGVFYTDLRQSE
jgi:hypothetical protein